MRGLALISLLHLAASFNLPLQTTGLSRLSSTIQKGTHLAPGALRIHERSIPRSLLLFCQPTRLRGGGKSQVRCSVVGVKDEVLNDILDTATQAALEAGKLMKEKVGAAVTKTKLSNKDLLTEIDPQCQRIIESLVKERFPDHQFLGEESVPPGAAASSEALSRVLGSAEWVWVVDPIDGTTNFVHGIPLSVVSIGVARRGRLVAGVVYDPYADELFAAAAGCGAFCNGRPVRCGEEAALGEAVVAAGSPTSMASIAPSLRGIAALMPACRTVRMFGSAALHLAWIAAGRLTAYFEPDLHSWDTAAGAVLVREAGGRLSGLDGSEYTLATRAVLASNGAAHDAILGVLQGAGVYGLDPPGGTPPPPPAGGA